MHGVAWSSNATKLKFYYVLEAFFLALYDFWVNFSHKTMNEWMEVLCEQVTQDHNIVSDGWTGASNPHPHPKYPTHIHKMHLKRAFSHFLTHRSMDRRTNRPTKPFTELRDCNWKKQGRIHGQYQSRTGGQGRKCVFSHFSTRAWRTNRRTDGPTKPLIESLVRD